MTLFFIILLFALVIIFLITISHLRKARFNNSLIDSSYRIPDKEFRIINEAHALYRQERIDELKNKDWPSEVMEVALRITAERDSGKHHLSFMPRNEFDVPSSLKRIAEDAGLKPKEDGWTELQSDQARQYLTEFFRSDQSYHVSLMTSEAALGLAEKWISIFGKEAKYFTNVEKLERKIRVYTNFTDASFDCGVAVVGKTSLGLVWFEDED